MVNKLFCRQRVDMIPAWCPEPHPQLRTWLHLLVIKYCRAIRNKRSFSLGDIKLEIDGDYDDFEDSSFNQKIDFVSHCKGSKSYEGTTNMIYNQNYQPSRAGLRNAIWLIIQFAKDLQMHEIVVKLQKRRKQRLMGGKLNNQSQEVTTNSSSAGTNSGEKVEEGEPHSIITSTFSLLPEQQQVEMNRALQKDKTCKNAPQQAPKIKQLFKDPQVQTQNIVEKSKIMKPPNKNKARMLDLILIFEQLHLLMLANKIFTIPTPSHPVLLFTLLRAFNQIIDEQVIDAQKQVKRLNRIFFKDQSQTLKAITQEDYFTQFISQQCHSVENDMNLPESNEYNLKHYLFLIVEQMQINNIELNQYLAEKDYQYLNIIMLGIRSQMNQHIQQWLPDKKPNQPKIKATIGYNIAVAQLRFGIINSNGEKHKFTIPFQINQLTHIKVDSLYQDIAQMKVFFPKYNCLADKLFQTITNRHSEQNLIVALCLECEKAKFNYVEPNSLFEEIYKQFNDQQYGNIESVYKIVLEIASVKQICPTCQLFLDSDHKEITSMIQNNLKDKQLIKNINNDLILRKRTVFIYEQIRTIGANNEGQLQNARISQNSSGIFSMEMILSRYSTGQKEANQFLGKPIKDIRYNNTMIFSGRNMDPSQFNEEILKRQKNILPNLINNQENIKMEKQNEDDNEGEQQEWEYDIEDDELDIRQEDEQDNQQAQQEQNQFDEEIQQEIENSLGNEINQPYDEKLMDEKVTYSNDLRQSDSQSQSSVSTQQEETIERLIQVLIQNRQNLIQLEL